jgi:hypothetical protein
MKPHDELELMFHDKRMRRVIGIDWLMRRKDELGEPIDVMQAAMQWDHQYADRTTNIKQLREIGIDLPDMNRLTDDEIDDALEEAVCGLRRLGISILGADNMCPKRMYQLLTQRILVEEVPDIPPNAGTTEYIDLTPYQSKETA